MMLNIKPAELGEHVIRYFHIGGLIGVLFVLEMFLILSKDLVSANFTGVPSLVDWQEKVSTLSNIDALGHLIYTHYYYLFIVAGLILLVAMIGAIVLTLFHKPDAKRQDINEQVNRSTEDSKLLLS